MAQKFLIPFRSAIEKIDSLHEIFRTGKDLVYNHDDRHLLLPDYFEFDEKTNTRKWKHSIIEDLYEIDASGEQTYDEFLEKQFLNTYTSCVVELDKMIEKCSTESEKKFNLQEFPVELEHLQRELKSNRPSIETNKLDKWIILFTDYVKEKYSDCLPRVARGKKLFFELVAASEGNLADLMDRLDKVKFIDKEATTIKQFRTAFGIAPNPSNEKIVWTGTLSEFVYFITQLKKQGKLKKHSGTWKIADEHFTLESNPNIKFSDKRKQDPPPSSATIKGIVESI